MEFRLKSSFKPTGDQPEAIRKLKANLSAGLNSQVLLGVTGSGKTFTLANVIADTGRPALVISHNKTLAAQLYQEFRDFFPENAVSYFVSYYDYYQPEAYIPRTDTYIEKETEINEEIDKLRLSATTNILTRKDTIIVASVSCIYNLGSPVEYGKFILELKKGVRIGRESIFSRLVELQYAKSIYEFRRSSFRTRGENIDIFPAYEDSAIRLVHDGMEVKKILRLDPLNGRTVSELDAVVIYPAKHYMTDPSTHRKIFGVIRDDLRKRLTELKSEGKELEAYRLEKRVNYDLEMIEEMGYVNGIENYSRYFDGRKPGDPPYSLLDYFTKPYGNDWLMIIDESHMTVPQIRGMYNGDRSRKQTLIDFGFRLPSALDNRPLRFDEFQQRMPRTIFVSATPDEWEIDYSKGTSKGTGAVVQQLIRPTGITDPEVEIRPVENQIRDLTSEILVRKKRNERVLVTTLTKRMAEDLSSYLNDRKYLSDKQFSGLDGADLPDVHYLHSDVETLDRSDILDDLRSGKYDVIVGINLLREGLDLPEVTLVAILDADKEGFLRSRTSLIQVMGRAARNVNSRVLMYADRITDSMKYAIEEVTRRRKIQKDYNRKHGIVPANITKAIREKLTSRTREKENRKHSALAYLGLTGHENEQMTPGDLSVLMKKLKSEMNRAAKEMNFELAAQIRDKIAEMEKSK